METLSDLFFHLRERSAGRSELLSIEREGRLETLSSVDFVRNVHSLALALEARGLERGERVAIFAENGPEWHAVDFACHLLGLPVVPLYPTLPAQQVSYVLRNSGSRWVFYSDAAKRDLLLAAQKTLGSPLHAVAWSDAAAFEGGVSITRLMGEGAERRGDVPLERFRGATRPEELASVVYTSGTGGDPKGVMLSHRNLVSNLLACGERFRVGPEDLALSALPLAHVYQRTVDYLCFHRGVAIRYLPAFERLGEALGAARPTVLAAEPGVYERLYRELRAAAEGGGWLRRGLFHWSETIGRRHAAARRRGFVGPLLGLERKLAEALVWRRVQRRFGGRLRLAISGGAPLAGEVGELLEAFGVPVYHGYGLTEASPVVATNAPGQLRQGSVGKPLGGVEVRLADDGEVLVRGLGVMVGYWEKPQATAETIDPDGWLRTGDLGHLDADGYLYVTGRKRDRVVTSGGEGVALEPIERRLTHHPLIAQAVVVGERHPYLAALLVPDLERLAAELSADGRGEAPSGELLEGAEARALLERAVEEVNAELAESEKVRRFRLLPKPLSLEAGELTPTLKVRRKAILERHAAEIAELYPPAAG